jgi:hypothetical protein
MKITHNVALNFHPIIIPLNQLFGAILDFIDFVRHKNEDLQLRRAAANLSKASFKRVWDNPEDDAYDSL